MAIGDRSRFAIRVFILFSGVAALSWEVLWQVKSTLALGLSALGTAITLATTMGGMSIGGFMMGRLLRTGRPVKAMRVYALLECLIGFAGLFLDFAFYEVERLDNWVYGAIPAYAPLIHIFSIVAVLGIPTICMGATLPVFKLIAQRFKVPLAELYGLNTLGAAAGVLFTALALIPWLGILRSAGIITSINFCVGLFAWRLDRGAESSVESPEGKEEEPRRLASWKEAWIMLVTGFATLALEIAWFRSLVGTFSSTTDMFAVMLASMLLALGLAARSVQWLKQKKWPLGALLAWAGILILAATPLIERFDIYYVYFIERLPKYFATIILDHSLAGVAYSLQILGIFLMTLCVIGPPVWFLGTAFPWIVDEQRHSRRVGALYALNTVAAIAGALAAAWILLPAIGFAKTAWIAGLLVAVTGIVVAPARNRILLAGLSMAGFLVAFSFESGVGKTRIQGYVFQIADKAKVLEAFDGPDVTASVIGNDDGTRWLVIDGTIATGQSGSELNVHSHYMEWMGRLPMLLHPDPKNALVICFGTGQTANAVREEVPQTLDIVDVNPRIFKLAHNFPSNKNVLNDPKVKAITMDGRAYLRRSRKTYDIITLEPMPPNFAGVNSLYSLEFYEAAWDRLSPNGVIAQWIPFHSVTPFSSASIARTFAAVFPNSILWIDPKDPLNAVLLGTKDNETPLGTDWPGFARVALARNLTEQEVKATIVLDSENLKRYGAHGEVITDDNQLLAYGKALYTYVSKAQDNYELINRVTGKIN